MLRADDCIGDISETQRNLILQYRDSNVFRQAYVSRYITGDTQAAYRGLKPQRDMIRAASGMTRSIDPRRPRHLTSKQFLEVRRHPEVKLLSRRRLALTKKKRIQYKTITKCKGTAVHRDYKEVCRKHTQKLKAVRKSILANVKATYHRQ